jgi:hypothetical protein
VIRAVVSLNSMDVLKDEFGYSRKRMQHLLLVEMMQIVEKLKGF